ncbi:MULTISPECIES: hypothetical protein [Acinetobacter]|uniref:Uncharacterized protein n=1 Tax=Acinetobacter indicus TaxID=756892 RepID=A0A6C0Y6Y7_9GAMM|nr:MULTISPECIES: hypothetical protein [Acinetobacter]QIC71863.1 hypothetical protein FSC09_15855 [Acinetobacter indicus]QKQ71399.1 hypothetical protein E5Y90_14305 [Acinetobacter sp. 10FS3-1]
MSVGFDVDVEGNTALQDLIAKTTVEHDVWLVQDGKPVAPGKYPEGMRGFIPTDQYLPIMDYNDSSFNSGMYMLLVEATSGYEVAEGFLMKWTDGDYFFWYNHDEISKVVGFMPLPQVKMVKPSKNKKIGTWG